MANDPIPMDPKYIVDLILKRRWLLLGPFILAMVVGIALAIKLPKIYQANTMILIQAQKVPQEYVQSIVTTDPSERINTLSQQILSRTNLEKVIAEFQLYRGEEYDNLYVEDKINDLRRKISVTVSNDRRRESDAFSISFQGKDPRKVMQITNTLASYFIDENLRLREAQAVGTSDFLDDELQSMKKRLEEVEVQLKKYRESYMGELPEQLDSNLRILDRLQEHLGESQQNLSEAKIRLSSLQNEISAMRDQTTTFIIGQEEAQEPTNLEQMKVHLESLRSRYTERHPDVVRLKARIKEMESQERSAASDLESSDRGDVQPRSRPLPPEFRAQRDELTSEMARLKQDIEDTQKQIQIYKQRVENTPKREQQLLTLRRDYQNIQTTYDSLLARKLEAEIAVNMERKQKGEQFRVLDIARLPEKPVKPDMKKLFIIVVGAGLAIGGGIIFLLEYLDNSFKRPEELEAQLNLSVLCTIPQIIDRKTKMWRGVERIICAGAGVLALLLFTGFAALSLKGVEQTIDLVKTIVNI